MVYIVFGVSGIGKTTIGKMLSKELDVPFFDADDFHPKQNIKKMKDGNPLNDTDRLPWLVNLSENIKKWNDNNGAVLACSALKESYREILQSIDKVDLKWIFLNAEMKVIAERLAKRENHYMNPNLLQSQFDALEVPKYGIHVDVHQPIEAIIDVIKNNI